MKKFIIIAGPQAAGKSTVISSLSEQYQNMLPLFYASGGKKPPFLFPLQESRQILIHKDVVLGGIFMNKEQEMEVVKCDMRRMELILQNKHENIIYLDECNIFTLAHAKAHGFFEILEHWKSYIAMLEKLQAAIIFLDTPLDLSWERRHHRYEQRLVCFPASEHVAIMERYYQYLKDLGPNLLDVYNNIPNPIPKRMIDGTLSKESVLRNVSKALAELSCFPTL
jgi:thymidylate kinase